MSVRGLHCFVLQSTCPPANDNLMELLVVIDALKRASAGEITAVIPYYGYGRQDRKVAPRAPITAKLVADLLETAGATRVISMDMHAGQIQGFFNVPFDHLYARPIFLNHIKDNFAPPRQTQRILSLFHRMRAAWKQRALTRSDCMRVWQLLTSAVLDPTLQK